MQTVEIPMEELVKILRLQLDTAGQAYLTVTGCSMLPMLRHHRDSVVLEPIRGRLEPGDIALYRRENGRYVLHRVISVTPEGYLFCGDNQAATEAVLETQLVALVVGYHRDGKKKTLQSFWYRLYRWRRVRLFFLRKYYIALRRRLGCLRRRLFK